MSEPIVFLLSFGNPKSQKLSKPQMYMTQFKICDSKQWQFLLFLTGRTIVIFTSILLFSESSIATAGQYPVNIAQITQTNDATRTAAELAYQEGKKLYQQGTAESLVQAIAKFEQANSIIFRSLPMPFTVAFF